DRSLPLRSWVQPVAKSVAQEIEPHRGRENRHAREGGHPPLLDEDAPLGNHRTPFWRRGPDAKPQERQAGERDDGVSDIEREERDEGSERVRQDMAEENSPG